MGRDLAAVAIAQPARSRPSSFARPPVQQRASSIIDVKAKDSQETDCFDKKK